MLDDPALIEIAGSARQVAAQVVLRWHIQRGNIVFPKSVTPAADHGELRALRLRARACRRREDRRARPRRGRARRPEPGRLRLHPELSVERAAEDRGIPASRRSRSARNAGSADSAAARSTRRTPFPSAAARANGASAASICGSSVEHLVGERLPGEVEADAVALVERAQPERVRCDRADLGGEEQRRQVRPNVRSARTASTACSRATAYSDCSSSPPLGVKPRRKCGSRSPTARAHRVARCSSPGRARDRVRGPPPRARAEARVERVAPRLHPDLVDAVLGPEREEAGAVAEREGRRGRLRRSPAGAVEDVLAELERRHDVERHACDEPSSPAPTTARRNRRRRARGGRARRRLARDRARRRRRRAIGSRRPTRASPSRSHRRRRCAAAMRSWEARGRARRACGRARRSGCRLRR